MYYFAHWNLIYLIAQNIYNFGKNEYENKVFIDTSYRWVNLYKNYYFIRYLISNYSNPLSKVLNTVMGK